MVFLLIYGSYRSLNSVFLKFLLIPICVCNSARYAASMAVQRKHNHHRCLQLCYVWLQARLCNVSRPADTYYIDSENKKKRVRRPSLCLSGKMFQATLLMCGLDSSSRKPKHRPARHYFMIPLSTLEQDR